jgi:hypothetical protein
MADPQAQGADPVTGNPPAGADAGAKGAESFVTSLVNGKDGSGSTPALPDGAQSGQPAKDQGASAKPATETQLAGWTAATTKELRADPRFVAWASKFESFDAAVKSAMELESKAGAALTPLTDKSTPEEIAAYHERIGAPKTADEYELTENKELSGTDMKAWKDKAFSLHLTREQAAGLWKDASESAVKVLADFRAKESQARAQARTDTESTLKKEWGDNYGKQVDAFNRALSKYGDKDLLRDLDASGAGNKASIVRFLARIGAELQEDTAIRSQTGTTGPLTEEKAASILYPKKQ